MNRKLGRLLEPGMEGYFIVMLLFAFAALVAGNGYLALAELAATGILFALYYFKKIQRRRELEAFIQHPGQHRRRTHPLPHGAGAHG